MVGRGKIPHRRHGGPSQRAPLERRTLQELERLIASGREPAGVLRRAKKVRRNKLGGMRSGAVRRSAADKRARAIRAAAAACSTAGEIRYVPKLMKRFGVSRSTVMRALRKLCHEPKCESGEAQRPRI